MRRPRKAVSTAQAAEHSNEYRPFRTRCWPICLYQSQCIAVLESQLTRALPWFCKEAGPLICQLLKPAAQLPQSASITQNAPRYECQIQSNPQRQLLSQLCTCCIAQEQHETCNACWQSHPQYVLLVAAVAFKGKLMPPQYSTSHQALACGATIWNPCAVQCSANASK
jgi:hypothetical protein